MDELANDLLAALQSQFGDVERIENEAGDEGPVYGLNYGGVDYIVTLDRA